MIRRLRCQVASVVDHGEHVFTVDLAPEGRLPVFKPGQFLHLTLDEYDPSRHWPESRVFSIASSPEDSTRVRILYSAIGSYSRRMERELRVGREVWIKLPYGDFVIDSSQNVVLVAGGTGISAYLAFLEALKPEHAHQVLLVYGTRNPDLMIYRSHLFKQLTRVPNLSAVLFAEQASTGFTAARPVFPNQLWHRLGRISVEEFWPILQEPLTRLYYLSGPPSMLNALSFTLRERGLPAGNVRTDAWE